MLPHARRLHAGFKYDKNPRLHRGIKPVSVLRLAFGQTLYSLNMLCVSVRIYIYILLPARKIAFPNFYLPGSLRVTFYTVHVKHKKRFVSVLSSASDLRLYVTRLALCRMILFHPDNHDLCS